MSIKSWRLARRAIQVLSLLFFAFALLYPLQDARSLFASDILMRLDPLTGLAAMLSERRWLAHFLPAVVIIAATLVLGRFWCGWLCPLGTFLDLRPRRSGGAEFSRPWWRSAKYFLLFTVFFAALWGNLTLLVLDPLTLFVRSVGTLVLPALTWLVTQAEIILYRVAFLRGVVDALDAALRGLLLSYDQPYYGGAVLLAVAVGAVFALNLLVRRAWCRYLCPLGGMLGLLSKAAWLKRQVSEACVSCGACAKACPMGTVDAGRGYASDSGECTLCLDCAAVCPKEAISFAGDWRIDSGWAYDPSRRQVLGALGTSLAGLALLRIGARAHHPDAHRLRPPGAEESSLLASCVRCGECLRVCPTHGLQPSLTESGLEGLWTPTLVPRLGHCEFSCTACGNVCPTGAIPRLTQPEKLLHPIGKAYVDPRICIPWSGRGDCIVCEEMCPLPEKAIYLRETTASDSQGVKRAFQAPVVLHERCIGCGLCESKCPVNGEAAIRVIVDPMS
jgi:polyferredoxin